MAPAPVCPYWGLSRLSFSPSVRSRPVVASLGTRREQAHPRGYVSPPSRLFCPLSDVGGGADTAAPSAPSSAAKVTRNGRSPSFFHCRFISRCFLPQPSPFELFILFVGAFELFVPLCVCVCVCQTILFFIYNFLLFLGIVKMLCKLKRVSAAPALAKSLRNCNVCVKLPQLDGAGCRGVIDSSLLRTLFLLYERVVNQKKQQKYHRK